MPVTNISELPEGGVREQDGSIKWSFGSFEERNRFVDEHFPERKMQVTPGMYKLPGGNHHLAVYMLDVWYYPRPGEREREED